jgi:GH15 family glucan-1,4-alpha-glucosidase
VHDSRLATPSPRVLREYSFIADGERGALVGPDGAIVWLCLPTWDSPAVFSGLLGGQGGYAITPADPRYVWGGYYEPGSLIWHSRWVTRNVTECREALAMPADPHCCVLLRRVEALDGPAKVRVVLDVRSGFGKLPMGELTRDRGTWTGRSGNNRFRWSGAGRACRDENGQLAMTLNLAAGVHHDFVLELSDRPLADGAPDPDQAWQATEEAWSGAVPGCDELIAVRDARASYAVLTGLTSSSGAMVAAATASLPERMDGVRNYDYRYAWIRDQCYAGLAVASHGPHPLVSNAVRFITDRLHADGAGLRPAYTVRGGVIPAERSLRLPGYPGSAARTGNRVNKQFQLDGLGEVLQLLAAAARHDMLGGEDWRAAEIAATAIEQRWGEPDAGVWELDNQRWAHSRLTCVTGLRAIAAAADWTPGSHGSRQASGWSALADKILASLSDCVHPTGRWQRAPSDERLDTALLLPGIHGVPGPDDPRTDATYRAVIADLAEDGFVYRFRQDSRPLHRAEGAFLLCGFWMAQAASAYGDEVAAAHWFERSRSACGPAGLYAEEYDVHQRQLRGNLPQAFVHAGMLATAARLSADTAGSLGG